MRAQSVSRYPTLPWNHIDRSVRSSSASGSLRRNDTADCVNQRGEVTTPGRATILLPSREHGPVRLPDPPGGASDLQPAAFGLRPELEDLVAAGLRGSAHGALVSGSGPTCLFLTESESHAVEVRNSLVGSVPKVLHAPGPVPGARVIR